MIQNDDNLAQKIENDGFVIIRNILSRKEVRKLRQIVKHHFFSYQGISAHFGLTQPNAAITVPDIGWLFYHPQILSVMRQLLREKEIMFTNHCDVHSRALSAWHKDDGMTVMDGGYFGQSMYENKDCCVYKVAIYLQDHIHNNGGLTVRKGSHKASSLDQGEEVYLKTKAGDIIVFDVRLTHTGQRDFVPIPWMKKPVKLLQKILNKFKISDSQSNHYFKKIYDKIFGERFSLFFTYGASNEYTINFAINNMKRQMRQLQSKNIFLQPSTRQIFLNNNVLLAENYFTELVKR